MEVNTPFYSGQLEALVMPSLLYDLIIGNVPGARGPGDPDPLFAFSRTKITQIRNTA